MIIPIYPLGLTGRDTTPSYGEPGTPERRYYIAHQVAKHHNQAIDVARREAECYERFTAARAAADTAWNALADQKTTNWPAAHHRWVIAEEELADATKAWTSAARDYEEGVDRSLYGEEEHAYYAKIATETGNPMLFGPRESPDDVVYELSERRCRRERLAAKTLTATR
ncbi:hypothetical protein [Streptosporangium sandarakinum]|uniref:Uncharacterized protein n=1 Tax=Streptosporangium sandarakinum TaxID=1260955 RepID=A0A852V9C4_9ACTN|nr:hypothetical protein [Streptosporangium sandarakinum]NYF44700.1 hypothetical protein [Streptosporangium sandarakinum]